MSSTAESHPRLLVVEDSPSDQLIYRHTLRDFDLSFADSGETGLQRLATESFDLVILDYQLPRMNGGEVLNSIRASLKLDIPVVVVTGGGSESVAVDLLKRGAYDYVTKDDLHTPRVAASVHASLKRHWLEIARHRAEEQLRVRNEELEVALRKLQEAQAQLVQSEKMASLGQLVAGVAHEINNPLSYVWNNLAVLDRDVRELAELMRLYRRECGTELPDSIREAETRIDIDYTLSNLDRLLSSSKQGLKRLREIVSGLRDFSRLDEAERKRIDPNDAVHSTIEMVRYQVRLKEITLETCLQELPPIWCYAGKLNQVLLNLLMNAIHAVEPGGKIRVVSEPSADRSEVRFIVQDDGPGIPAAIRGKIYDPFFTTKPQGVGTGLGLWITYNIVKEHEGRIDLDTEVGRGTRFTVTLPVRRSDDPL